MPRVGAFIIARGESKVDSGSGVIHAPVAEICFNGSIVHNDGLLANSIARKEQISYSEACALMDQGIDRMAEALAVEGEVSIGRLGRLMLTEESRIGFTPLYTPAQRAGKLGYCSVEIPRKAEVSEAVALRGRDSYIRLPRRVLKIAAAVLILVMGGLSFILPGLTSDPMVDYASVVPVKVSATRYAAPVAPGEEFNLVVASFSTEQKAVEYINACDALELDLTVVPAYGRYRVVAMRAGEPEELLDIMSDYHFAEAFPGSWIWERR